MSNEMISRAPFS